ncbi:uncharacterized protein LOC144944642 [Lampetra fluviatilis]
MAYNRRYTAIEALDLILDRTYDPACPRRGGASSQTRLRCRPPRQRCRSGDSTEARHAVGSCTTSQVAHVDDDDDDHHDDDDDEEEDESEGLCRRRGHYRVLARRLNAQRSSGRPLCDVSLRMGGHVAHAHRGLLAAVSPYFRAMFAGGFRERILGEVSIDVEASPESAECVMRHMYLGDTSLSATGEYNVGARGTAREVLLLSDFFSLPLLHSVAAEFLRARGLDASITGYSSIAWLTTATDTANETDTCSAAFTDERSIS